MAMAASEMVFQVLSTGLHGSYCSDPCFKNFKSVSFISNLNNRRSEHFLRRKLETKLSTFQRWKSSRFRCQKTDSIGGLAANEDIPVSFPVNGTKNLEISGQSKHAPHGHTNSAGAVKDSLLEEEAWDLLRASIVYYCSNPIGTIAANDPSDTSILNYDQVFIRDFIPSGIAFLLKGEYEIVRNFILYTLQLQVVFDYLLCSTSICCCLYISFNCLVYY